MAAYPNLEQLFESGSSSASATDIIATLAAANALGGSQVLADRLSPLLKNSGIATIVGAGTSIVVAHGLAATPTADQIQVTPIEDMNTAARFWFDTIGATNFTIHVNAVPTTDVDFAWRADRV